MSHVRLPPCRTLFLPNPRRKVEIALDFARGMAYLHSRRLPIVHRDLKPANLMISGNLHADTEQLFLDSGVIKVVRGKAMGEEGSSTAIHAADCLQVADFGLSKSLQVTEKKSNLNNDTFKLTGETGSYRCGVKSWYLTAAVTFEHQLIPRFIT